MLAASGVLVAQDPNDQPVEVSLALADRVRAELSKVDRRASAARQVIMAQELRCAVPSSWTWRGLADLVLFIDCRGNTPPKSEHGVRLVTAKNVKRGNINQTPEEFVSEEIYKKWMRRGFPKRGDVLFTTEAPMGNAAVVADAERFALAQRVICFSLYGAIEPEFLVLQILSQSSNRF